MEITENDIDRVLSREGRIVYTTDWANRLREENLEKLKNKKPIKKFIPQEGFQEKVCVNQADVLFIGGKRGGGKTAALMFPLIYNINNPLFTAYAYRKEEADLRRGIWNCSKSFYTKLATPTDLKWTFPSGATFVMEHLQDEKKIDQRMRGAELAMIEIDEVNLLQPKTFFTLFASNRNTIGVRSKMFCTCNPVPKSNWVYKMVQWWIDESTGTIIKERCGKIRYFFKWGETAGEIAWGDTKEEVYLKAKSDIDKLLRANPSRGYEPLIASFSFIEGDFADNKILDLLEPNYLGKVAQSGSAQSIKDVNGIWGSDESSSAQITTTEIEELWFKNTAKPEDKILKATCDVALSRDFFTLNAWRGRHLFDVEYFCGIDSTTAAALVKKFLDKHSIREENFAYDYNGIGLYLEGHFPKAIPFNNKSQSSNPKVWDCLKSECAEKFIENIKAGKYSVSEFVLSKKIVITQKEWSREKRKGDYSTTWGDRILEESKALQRKQTDNGKWEIITKATMKELIGHSPDFIEGSFMVEAIPDSKPRQFRNLGMF